jgi:DedD protein
MASPVEKPQPAVTPVQPAAESKAPEIAKPAAVLKPVEQVLPVEEKPATSSVKTAPEVARAVNDTKEKATLPAAEIKPKSQPVVTPKKGSFLVQIGVFSDAAKVKQLRARIAEKGIQCYTEDMNTPKGIKIRLRCGPFAARAEAQQALETLKTAGFGGMLVTNQ